MLPRFRDYAGEFHPSPFSLFLESLFGTYYLQSAGLKHRNTICRDIPLTLARACIIFVVCTAYTTLWRHDFPWVLQWNSWFCHFFPHPNYYQKTLLISQSLVCLCYPYLYDQATYGINHTELCCVCRYWWSRRFSKIPHSLRSCGIFKKPLDHNNLHTSIVQYCLKYKVRRDQSKITYQLCSISPEAMTSSSDMVMLTG